MERICPFLASRDDGRTVSDGYDPAHRCRATQPAEPVDRAQQAAFCLDPAFRSCDRYAAAMQSRGGAWPAPAADAVPVQTRLVLAPLPARRRLVSGAAVGPNARRWAGGGALATVGVVAVASGVAGSLGSLIGGPSPSPGATGSGSLAALPSGSPAVTTEPTAMPSSAAPAPSVPATQAPQPAPTAASTAAPTTYVVQPGDTLNGIAVQFGTTVAAIQAANGMGSSDVIVVGQVLIIP